MTTHLQDINEKTSATYRFLFFLMRMMCMLLLVLLCPAALPAQNLDGRWESTGNKHQFYFYREGDELVARVERSANPLFRNGMVILRVRAGRKPFIYYGDMIAPEDSTVTSVRIKLFRSGTIRLRLHRFLVPLALEWHRSSNQQVPTNDRNVPVTRRFRQ